MYMLGRVMNGPPTVHLQQQQQQHRTWKLQPPPSQSCGSVTGHTSLSPRDETLPSLPLSKTQWMGDPGRHWPLEACSPTSNPIHWPDPWKAWTPNLQACLECTSFLIHLPLPKLSSFPFPLPPSLPTPCLCASCFILGNRILSFPG